MARKYIKQIINQNFIFPNDNVSEYDVEIVNDINNNSVSGTVANLTATTVSYSAITFTYDWQWDKNGAEPYIMDSGNISLVSVHMLAYGQNYFKPWRLVDDISDYVTGSTTYSSVGKSFTVTPSQMGLSAFSNGIYYFEFRFIGHRAIFPVCAQFTVGAIPTPTPTPTPTATSVPPTPTPTPTAGPNIYTTGATINVTDTGWIKYNMSSGSTYQNITSTGSTVLTNCLDCSTIMVGIPFANTAVFTITNCGSSCSAAPTPTPTATANDCTSTVWRIDNSSSGYDIYWAGDDCNGNPVGGTVGAYQIAYTGCVADYTLTYTGFPIVTVSAYC